MAVANDTDKAIEGTIPNRPGGGRDSHRGMPGYDVSVLGKNHSGYVNTTSKSKNKPQTRGNSHVSAVTGLVSEPMNIAIRFIEKSRAKRSV